MVIWRNALVIGLTALLPFVTAAEIYKYTDERGVAHYVDSPSKIPERYRSQAEIPVLENRLSYPEPPSPGNYLIESATPDLAQELVPEWETPITILGNRVIVPVTLGYRNHTVQTTLILDTGASTMFLHRELASRLYIERFAHGRGQVADGTTIRTEIAVLDYVQVGPFRKANLQAAFVENKDRSADYSGLLGMNFLRELDYSIDYERRVVRWRIRS